MFPVLKYQIEEEALINANVASPLHLFRLNYKIPQN